MAADSPNSSSPKEQPRLVKWLSNQSSLATLTVLFIVLVTFVLYIAFSPRGKIYSIDANTEIVGFTVMDPIFSEWDVSGATLFTNPFEDSNPPIPPLPDESTLFIGVGTQVEVQRHGVGPVRIRLICDGASVGHLRTAEGTEILLDEWASLQINLTTAPAVLSFRGQLSIGEDISSQVNSVLLEGNIRIVEQKPFTRGHYTAGEEILDPGDRVQLWINRPPPSKKPRCAEPSLDIHDSNVLKVPGKLDGFIRAEPASFSEAVNALQLMAHGKADYARVERFGSAGYEIKTQPWVRFANDPILTAIVAILAVLVLCFEAFFKATEFISKYKQSDPGQKNHED